MTARLAGRLSPPCRGVPLGSDIRRVEELDVRYAGTGISGSDVPASGMNLRWFDHVVGAGAAGGPAPVKPAGH